MKCDLEVLPCVCRHYLDKMIRTLRRRKLLTKRSGETATPILGSRKSLTLSVSILKQRAQFIRPGACQLFNLRFNLLRFRRGRSQRVYADEVMDARQNGF